MGDRTYVTLTVLAEQADEARDLGADEANIETDDGQFVQFEFEEVNYATLDFESDLIAAGIAFDKRWDAGGDYTAGTQYVRFKSDGLLQNLEICDEDANPPLEDLLPLCDDPGELVRYIRAFAAGVTPLPWEGQVEYGKLYAETQP